MGKRHRYEPSPGMNGSPDVTAASELVDVRDSWHVLIPVKQLGKAKSRLAPELGPRRAELALAFARDTTAAALRCEAVAAVTVVTGDRVVAEAVRADGAQVFDDRLAPGLNLALAAALDAMPGFGSVALLLGDLPALTPQALARALRAASGHETAFVPDSSGTGTTLLAARRREALRIRFGTGSASAHAEAGAAQIAIPGLITLRSDVDSFADLVKAAVLGLGEHTRSAVSVLGLSKLIYPTIGASSGVRAATVGDLGA